MFVLDAEYVFSYAQGMSEFLSNDFGYLPEMIVVGIPNTDRHRDLFVTLYEKDGYVNFVSFLSEELLPFIRKTYRVNDFEILYGWSSGSGICTYVMLSNPESFDAYILSGTGIGARSGKLVASRIPEINFENHYIYANTEELGPRKSALLKYSHLFDSLNPKGIKWKFEIMEGANHVDVLAYGYEEGLRFVFDDFYILDSIVFSGFDPIMNYYVEIDKNYNFDIMIPVGAINESTSMLLNQDKTKEAIKLLEHGIKEHPYSATLFGTLAEVHEMESEFVLAMEYYQKALERPEQNPSAILKYSVLLKGLPVE